MGSLDLLKNKETIDFFPLNVGCGLDIPTGSYYPGPNGEQILVGGLSALTGIVGRPNSNKSTLAHHLILKVLGRHSSSEGFVHDTEITATYRRLNALAVPIPNLGNINLEESDRFILTNGIDHIGNKWNELYKQMLKQRRDDPKNYLLTTPFIDKNGKRIKAYAPLAGEIDSFSQMDFEVVEKLYEKNEVGHKDLNTEALRSAGVKSQFFGRLPVLTKSSGGFLILTAHVGDKHQLDPSAPPSKQLTFLKGNDKIKKVPENFNFLLDTMIICLKNRVLLNQNDKTPEFPRDKEDSLKGDTDLVATTIMILRSKNGASGIPIDLVISQSEGVQESLGLFYMLKNNDRFGLPGNNTHYHLALCPDIPLQRTKLRGKFNANYRLRRALEIMSQILQMRNHWHANIDKSILIDPSELYDRIKAKGYDWVTLLENSRGYWLFDEEAAKEPLQYLSTMDLLNMARDKDDPKCYHPKWYDKFAKLQPEAPKKDEST